MLGAAHRQDRARARVLHHLRPPRVLFHRQRQLSVPAGRRQADLPAAAVALCAARSGMALRTGMVQTAYANGAPRAYIQDALGIVSAVTPTGAKHVPSRPTGTARRYKVSLSDCVLCAKAHCLIVCTDSSLPSQASSVSSSDITMGSQKQTNAQLAQQREAHSETEPAHRDQLKALQAEQKGAHRRPRELALWRCLRTARTRVRRL